MRLSLGTTPSQKSTTVKTQISQPNGTKSLFLPTTPSQSQKRFSRKNNSSIQKKLNKTNNNLDQSLSSVRNMISNISSRNVQEQKNIQNNSKYLALDNYVKFGNVTNRNSKKIEFRKNNLSFTNGQIAIGKVQRTVKIQQDKKIQKSDKEPLNQIDSYRNNIKTNNIRGLQVQLDRKQKQIQKLEDERRKFRNMYQDIKRQQLKMKQQLVNIKYQHQNQIKKKDKCIKQLQQDLKKQKINIQIIKKSQSEMSQNLRVSQRQKSNVVKKLNQFIQRKIPKNLLQLQSWKQVSLQQQINQLKLQANRSKSDIQLNMQNIIKNLQRDKINLSEELKSSQIANRLLLHKMSQTQKYLQSYNMMKNQYNNMRMTLKQFKQECQILQKQNARIKRQIKNNKKQNYNSKQSKPSIIHLRVPSQTQSLSFSVYSRQ